MASIYSKNGFLYLDYYYIDQYGRKKRHQQSLKIKDSRENRILAKKIKIEKEAELIKANQKVMQHTITLGMAFKKFMKIKETTAKSTKQNYNLMYNHFTSIIPSKTYIQKISKNEIQSFEYYLREELKLSQNSIASYFRHLKAFWNWMVSEKLYSENIVHSVRSKEKPIEIIPDEDFDKILNFLKSKSIDQYRIIKFLQLTGLRIGEATSLKWEWINFDRRRIIFKNFKGNRTEEFPLYPTLWKFLYNFRKSSGPVFNYKNVESLKFWHRTMEKLGFKYKKHSIRKTFATKLVQKDISIFDAMKLLRHRNVTTTIKYYTAVDLDRIGNNVENVFHTNNDVDNESKKSKISSKTRIFNIKLSNNLG